MTRDEQYARYAFDRNRQAAMARHAELGQILTARNAKDVKSEAIREMRFLEREFDLPSEPYNNHTNQ